MDTDINITDTLVESFNGKLGESVVTCAAEVLKSIIQSVSPLLHNIEKKDVIARLLNDAFNPDVIISLEKLRNELISQF